MASWSLRQYHTERDTRQQVAVIELSSLPLMPQTSKLAEKVWCGMEGGI